MTKYKVAISKYKEKNNSINTIIEKSDLFKNLKSSDNVFIKPNIVVWTDKTVFPKWGVITTSRVIEETVIALKDMGVKNITIGEGITTLDPKNTEASNHAYKTLGYDVLSKKYGVKFLDIFKQDFKKVDIDEDSHLMLNSDVLNHDFIVNIPVLKTHAQAKVSLGLKNLKGLLNIPSRKKCHSAEQEKPLDYYISKIIKTMPPMATIIDGIYSLEKGPTPDGRARRSDLLIASTDPLSCDMVGAKTLGYDPKDIKHIVFAAEETKRPLDLSDIELIGEPIEKVASFHDFDFHYNEEGTLHKSMEKRGIKGLSYKKYDDTMCTYCSIVNGAVLTAISFAWTGEPWDNVEVLTGKKMQPTPNKKKTILLGQCMYNLHKDNPVINEILPIKGCPPSPKDTVEAFHKAGININPEIFKNIEMGLGFFMSKYKDKEEFEESFFQIN